MDLNIPSCFQVSYMTKMETTSPLPPSPSSDWTLVISIRIVSTPFNRVFCIYLWPKCRPCFSTHEQRSTIVGSGECTRVQVSVRILPEARGWQCVLCNQHIQRRDVKMHLQVHNRGEILRNMNNVCFLNIIIILK